VYDTDNANKKEKYEADLNKEIKNCRGIEIKSRRGYSPARSRIKSASYKQSLLDARKQIEREMERFKICEKETKTKAFSKEGLGQQPKTVGELESQVDTFEADLEGLTVNTWKNRPPRLVNDVNDFLEDYVERNQDDFDEVSDVDELYETLPPDKVEALEDLVAIGQPCLVKVCHLFLLNSIWFIFFSVKLDFSISEYIGLFFIFTWKFTYNL
ncbi:hypothetical protein V2J09_008651, partial [Rumex salicifolius]